MPCLFGKIELLCDRATPRGQAVRTEKRPCPGTGAGMEEKRLPAKVPVGVQRGDLEEGGAAVDLLLQKQILARDCRPCRQYGKEKGGDKDQDDSSSAENAIHGTPFSLRSAHRASGGDRFPIPLPLYNTRIFIHIARENVKCLLKSAAPLLRIRLQPGYPKFHARKNTPPALLPAGRCHSEIYLWISRGWKQHGRIRQFCRPHE